MHVNPACPKAGAAGRIFRKYGRQENAMAVKYVFVTGGVVSGLGKGITAASLGRLLKARGYQVTMQKFDPYINIDPGTMNPVQHGEVFVTEDGTETDLDLGHSGLRHFIFDRFLKNALFTAFRQYFFVKFPAFYCCMVLYIYLACVIIFL